MRETPRKVVLIGLFAPPIFASEEETKRARVFRDVVLMTMLIVSALFPIIMVGQPSTIPRALYALIVLDTLGLILLEVSRRARTHVASVLFISGLVLLVTTMALTAGGIRSVGATMYFVIVLMAGLLLGERGGVITALVCAALGLGLVGVEAFGVLPAQTAPYSATTIWLLNCIYMGVVIVLLRLATRTITAALRRAESELAERRNVEHQRERLVVDLGKRVKELKLLHIAAQLLHDRSFDRTVLTDLVRKLPAAWMYPECCEARIAYLDIEVSTPGFRVSPWRQSEHFATKVGEGLIEIVYLNEQPPAHEGPFLAEERQLLKSLAEMLVASIERDRAQRRRRQAEQDVKENQALLQTMIENTPAAVAMFDMEMRYIACSRRWLNDYQLGNKELKGLSHYEVFPEISEDWKAVHRRCLAGRIESREADRFLRADGTEDIVRWIVQPWRRGSGEIGGITMFTEVITDRKRDEQERQALEARLRQSQKMESLGTLAGGIAHDFNNILGAIYGFAALLGEDNANKADDQRFVQRIRSACERGRDLIAQIRTFSLAEGAEREVVDMVRIVRQSSDMLLASFPISTRLRFNYADEQLPVLGSDALLGQLIANLCINASEALDGNPGEVIVDIGRATSSDLKPLRAKAAISGERLIGEIAPSNDYAVLRISDTAGGISDAVLDRMFEPFFTTKGRQRGTGLGLAVVHGVIKSHGGACHVTSVPGKGATFSVYLPLQQGRVAQPKAGQPAADLHGGERLLIVDDEPDIVDMLSIGLERLGYETVGVTDPFEALAAFEENPEAWDTVITDQVMPQMSGVELVRKLKTVRPAIKVVLCTGYGEKAEESFSADWIDALVRKPADAAIIASKLRKLIDSRVVP